MTKGLAKCDKCDYFISVEEAYQQGRADAEKEFQNSDYWNDYIAKVIADTKTDAIDEIMEMLNNEWTLDSILCATDKYRLIAIFKRIAEQLKEQNNK